MRQLFARLWLAASMFAFTVVLGCHHVGRHCDCDAGLQTTSVPAMASGYKTIVPGDQPFGSPYAMRPASAVIPASAPASLPAHIPDADMAHAAKKPEATLGIVLVPVVAPAPAGSNLGSITGTIALTPAAADAMGIKPGVTPDALLLPNSAVNVEDLPAADTNPEPIHPKGL